MLTTLLALAFSAVPPQAPLPPQAPPVLVAAKRSDACPPVCDCGCNDGSPCTCSVKRTVAAAGASGSSCPGGVCNATPAVQPAPVVTHYSAPIPIVHHQPTVIYHQPMRYAPATVQYAAPMTYYRPAFAPSYSFGGSCAGGG